MTDNNVLKLSEPSTFSDPLTEVLRNGARSLLAQAVEAEVAAFLDFHAEERTEHGRRRLVRHGHLPEREIMTGIGPVAVRAPRVRDRVGTGETAIRFSSALLPPYARRSKSLEALIPILYLKGVSTGDFAEALAALLGPDAGGLSAATIARLKDAWADEHTHWCKRDLSARRYVYFWADGIHVQARLEDDAQCLLVIIGATPEGRKELVGLVDGVRESAQSWRDLLLDLRRRGLAMGPELAVADGALGFWKAIEEVWPTTPWPALLGAQDGERPEQAAEEPASQGQAGTARDLDGRDQSRCRGRARRFCRDLWRQVRQGRGVPDQGPPGDAGLLRLPGRALEAFENQQSHRKHVRHRAPSNRANEGMPVQQNRARHDLQARPGRREKLAPPRRTQPVAQADRRCKVRRRDRSRQATASSRRLIPTVTKIRL